MPVQLSDTKLWERGGMQQQQTLPTVQSKAAGDRKIKERQIRWVYSKKKEIMSRGMRVESRESSASASLSLSLSLLFWYIEFRSRSKTLKTLLDPCSPDTPTRLTHPSWPIGV